MSVPHVRGDEPRVLINDRQSYRVFPTSVGMNRRAAREEMKQECVPHVRGDEPALM